MANTITIDNVPEGFELTGEYRIPNSGEWYLFCASAVEREKYFHNGPWPILRKIEPPKPPDGWELTGEYRAPKKGEWFVTCDHSDTIMQAVDDCKEIYRRWILRRLEPPKPPEGYKLTGEYRVPRKGDYYCYSEYRNVILCDGENISCKYETKRWILRKLEPPKAPAGYELTGEYRQPLEGESWIDPSGFPHNHFRNNYIPAMGNDTRRWILRKVWQAPAWMPKGAWLYHNYGGSWCISRNQPFTTSNCGLGCFASVNGVLATSLAALHGETFTPPTHTNCLQIQ